jgi:hypothetical protein
MFRGRGQLYGSSRNSVGKEVFPGSGEGGLLAEFVPTLLNARSGSATHTKSSNSIATSINSVLKKGRQVPRAVRVHCSDDGSARSQSLFSTTC